MKKRKPAKYVPTQREYTETNKILSVCAGHIQKTSESPRAMKLIEVRHMAALALKKQLGI